MVSCEHSSPNWFRLTFEVSLLTVAVVGNVLVILSVGLVKVLRKPKNYLLLSLAIADLLIGIFVLPSKIVLTETCKVWNSKTLSCGIITPLQGEQGGNLWASHEFTWEAKAEVNCVLCFSFSWHFMLHSFNTLADRDRFGSIHCNCISIILQSECYETESFRGHISDLGGFNLHNSSILVSGWSASRGHALRHHFYLQETGRWLVKYCFNASIIQIFSVLIMS